MVQTLPQPIRNLLVVDNTPYIRPLISYFNRHRPLGVVHIDRKEAHFFKVFLGEIHEIGRIKDEVPRRVRAGGWQGYEEKKIDRHVQDRIAHHFQNTAQTLLPLFKKEELEGLVLIGNKKNVSEFKSFLHPYLKERHLADLELDRLPKEKEILKEVLKLEGRQELARQKPVFEKWVEGVEKKSMAVGGLRQTLHALNQGIVRVLFVGDTCRAQGKRCNACNELRVDGSLCSQCQELLDSVPDVVDEAEQLAVQQDIEIYSVHANAQLERYGGIGALLRYHNKS
jgi:peptide subunit release factor 1 (eRF1)